MTAYYILALVTGLLATAISFYGMKHESFPGKSIMPVVALTAVLAFGTLGAAIMGGINERQHEEGLHAEKTSAHSGDGAMIGNETVIEEGQR